MDEPLWRDGPARITATSDGHLPSPTIKHMIGQSLAYKNPCAPVRRFAGVADDRLNLVPRCAQYHRSETRLGPDHPPPSSNRAAALEAMEADLP
jgi:hypothetical protein